MPYIKKNQRNNVWTYGPQTVGDLTFLLTDLLKGYLLGKGESYQTYAEMLGALAGAKLDLIERKIKPYEAKKCAENGDVW